MRDFRRREKRDVELTAMMVEPDYSFEALGDGGERQALAMALSRLTLDQRDVILLRLLGELSNAEVALLLGKSEGSVRALQFRAIQQMRLTIAPAPPE